MTLQPTAHMPLTLAAERKQRTRCVERGGVLGFANPEDPAVRELRRLYDAVAPVLASRASAELGILRPCNALRDYPSDSALMSKGSRSVTDLAGHALALPHSEEMPGRTYKRATGNRCHRAGAVLHSAVATRP
jgi:hypothetical protein